MKYQLNNAAIHNISMIPYMDISNRECSIHINNTYDISLPLLVVLANSSLLTQEFMSDVTKLDFYINIDTTDSINDSTIQKIKSFMLNYEVILTSDDEIIQFAQFGKCIGNTSFLIPFQDLCKETDKKLNTSNVISSLKRKISLSLDPKEFSKEIDLLSSNFISMKSDIVSLSYEESYSNVIADIVNSKHLKLNTEDDLLRFVIELCSCNLKYAELFPSVHLEYCSVKCIREFIDFVSQNIITDRIAQSIITCMGSRLLAESLPKNPSFIQNRHIPTKEDNMIEITDKDPLNGIFHREGMNDNVSIQSPDNHNWEKLIKADDSFDTCPGSSPNYYIKVSLKNKKSFITTKYMIRWRNHSLEGYCHLKSWKLEGLRKSDEKWIEIDKQENQAREQLQYKVFPLTCKDELIAVKLTQTELSSNGNYGFGINAFDIFGLLEK